MLGFMLSRCIDRKVIRHNEIDNSSRCSWYSTKIYATMRRISEGKKKKKKKKKVRECQETKRIMNTLNSRAGMAYQGDLGHIIFPSLGHHDECICAPAFANDHSYTKWMSLLLSSLLPSFLQRPLSSRLLLVRI